MAGSRVRWIFLVAGVFLLVLAVAEAVDMMFFDGKSVEPDAPLFLCHSSITNLYRATRNLFLAQRFARHASPLTTIVYTHPADEELWEGVRYLPC